MTNLTCFKAYDIRGEIGENLNEDIVYRIGRAYCEWLKPKTVAVGGDIRKTSELFKQALAKGLMDGGCDVIDIGMVGTEEIYYATRSLNLDGGIEVTASHNPINFNGMKLVREDAKPISGDTGLNAIKALAEENNFAPVENKGQYKLLSNRDAYVSHLLSYINAEQLKPLKIVVNAGNGAAGPTIDAIEERFKQTGVAVEFIKVNHEPDSSFPNGIPNPMLLENRTDTQKAILSHGADLGIAWDGDFDRCFFFDENAAFIEGYYIVGLLANTFLLQHAGEKIIHDPRLTWNTQDLVASLTGTAIESKTGHAFIKERMRKENAVYGGEMSAHHYFRDFGYCDSGMIPWLLVIELISKKNEVLSKLVEQRVELYPISGEINTLVSDPEKTIAAISDAYQAAALNVTHIDGLSMEFTDWRFNLRSSNTEAVIRLNVESRGSQALVEQKTQELLVIINS
ncbi:phosphomannomutase/phosphoglucomutase [Psychromonas ossibalaenae]|uniref:phosphomannomutase/phosphoglucomutase n=1 Tax=Psychromonas ossibalaenae TaxID=444922 RepID=UPI000376D6D1|nr:phosphomannomutase/phosphoglucomutase [Psychromonas ossibalaenae]